MIKKIGFGDGVDEFGGFEDEDRIKMIIFVFWFMSSFC
jgi:hypothetical protein